MATLFFKSIFPGADILVFEPDPAIFRFLEKNISKNGVKDVRLVNAGLGKKNGKLRFFPDGSDGGSFCVDNRKGAVEVDIVRLSDYINAPVNLLKMNIEGMEGEVFREIEPRLHLIEEIIFEYHAFHDLPQNLGDILNILDRNGFKYTVTEATCAKASMPFRMPEKYRFFNLVFAKNEKKLNEKGRRNA